MRPEHRGDIAEEQGPECGRIPAHAVGVSGEGDA